MLLQAGKASSPEAVEAAKLQGRGITGTLLDSPTQWISLRYDSGLNYFYNCRCMYARLFLSLSVQRSGTAQFWYLRLLPS